MLLCCYFLQPCLLLWYLSSIMNSVHHLYRLKFFQTSGGGHVTVTSTSSKILHSLSGLSHPISRLILSAVRGHLDAYNDGGLRTALLMLR